jgi:hypothetical protein
MVIRKSLLLVAAFAAVALVIPAASGTAEAATKAKKTGKSDSSKPAPASCGKRIALVRAFDGDLKEMINYTYGTGYNNTNDPNLVQLKEYKLPDKTKKTAKTGVVYIQKNGKKQPRRNYQVTLQRHQKSVALLKQKANTAEYENVIRALGVSSDGAKKSAEDMLAQWNRVNKDANCNNKAEAAKVKELSKKRISYIKQFKSERKQVQGVSKNTSKAYQKAAKDYKKKAAAERRANRNNNVTGGAAAPSN